MEFKNKIDDILSTDITLPAPFLDGVFFDVLESSQSASPNTGWSPIYFQHQDSWAYSYIKSHSYGEYIFDWAWADLYNRMELNYYPKLIHALPFTPVNEIKLIGDQGEQLSKEIKEFYLSQDLLNSHHYLFINTEEAKLLEAQDYFIQKSIQYHWNNEDWNTFDAFLSSLKARKRKQIKKERREINTYELKFELKYGSDLTSKDIEMIYQLYLSTIDKKQSQDYLNEAFFKELPKFKDNFLVYFALKDGKKIAMSTFFKSETTLYGRYWGILPEYDYQYNYLHFEMCYYLGIEFAIKNGLKLFEAGAQGEQKLLRGFRPVEILSAHHLKHPMAAKIVKEHVKHQNLIIKDRLNQLNKHLPYKSKS